MTSDSSEASDDIREEFVGELHELIDSQSALRGEKSADSSPKKVLETEQNCDETETTAQRQVGDCQAETSEQNDAKTTKFVESGSGDTNREQVSAASDATDSAKTVNSCEGKVCEKKEKARKKPLFSEDTAEVVPDWVEVLFSVAKQVVVDGNVKNLAF